MESVRCECCDEIARKSCKEDERDGCVVEVVILLKRGDDGSVSGIVEAKVEECL